MLDILIKNGTVIDGTGGPGKKMDVAVEKGRITELAPQIKSKATLIINAQDRFVTPGFIDVQNHSDSYWTILEQPDQLSMLSQGISTIIMGNCGASLAPLLSSESIKTIQKWHNLSGINLNWQSMHEFMEELSHKQLGVNAGTLVGHATLRRGLVGDQIRQLTQAEQKTMNRALQDALDQGALGLSMGLIYAHEVNSSIEELTDLVQLLKPAKKYLSVHLRSEGSHILEAADEVIELAAKTQVPIKISHLKVRGKKNWHLFDRLMSKLEIAYHQGINISYDVYPYNTSWTVLYTYLPKWAYEGGREQILKMISDPMSRRKILDYLKGTGQEFGDIIISEASGAENFVGKTLRQIGSNQGVSPEEAVLNVISATKAQVMVFDHNLSDEQVELFCSSPLSLIATDGAGYSGRNQRLLHPRCFGAMPRFLRMVRENKILKWEQAIRKLTSEPARLVGLDDLGIIAENRAADITIFDPLTITDTADYQNPDSLSEGIDAVVVNGKLAYQNKQVQHRNGMVVGR
ncbi:MAG: amidohydrolase family protein [Candidatus Doudnabacteria bacterium]|nr:amidohydrolase family protein [Candidatus Doudnabacteria bacterium]